MECPSQYFSLDQSISVQRVVWRFFFVSIQILIEYYARKRWNAYQTLRTVASEPDLHCSNMLHKKDGMLINVVWVILFCFFTSHQQSFSYIGTGLPGLNQY